ncbi:hypothetical protein, conserved [Eimeria tenella]|uniref:Uncharacterized protein n=1 Tax=Eimeria tenella TaxID=5802 RepID=U6KYN5_EIMTE|nr:hypothetical protein, conserved [Eimeria tenella]CDJ43076.1 hypothetical protein, conserved [Eimeria tenella]|eukprot:XP_013233826.1 hypothetical protein, conserved [Eimeria tenella]
MQLLVEAAALGLLFCGLLWAGPVEGSDSSRWPERYIYLQSGRAPAGRYGAYGRKTTGGSELHRKSIPCEESSSISDGSQIGPALARTASEVGQHRALLLSIALGLIFLVRGYYISKSGSKPSEIQSLRNKLESRMDRLATEKAKLLESKARLSEMQRQIAHEQGIAQGQKLHLERQKLLLHAEEEELRSRESRMEAERASLREVEKEARQTKKVFLGNKFPEGNEGNEDLQAAGRTHTLGQAADMMKRVEAELGVFETAVCSSSQASKRTLLVREFTELAKMRAAITVLRSLPEEPTNAEEARDILRARRLLLAAAVRCQVISWSTIHRLLQLKVELQAEMILENSGKEGLEKLREVAETEWQVQEGQQKRARCTLTQLEQEIKKCREKQRQLHEYGANHKNLRRDAVKRLEKQLFDWESYEVTVRATKARILATEASASTTREVFLRQKRAQIQRAIDNQAQRWRRLPNDSIRVTELQTLLSAVSDELEEAREIYDMAKEVKEAYEAKHPVTEETPSSAQQKQQAKPHKPLVFEERRRTYLYDRGNLGSPDSSLAKSSHALPVISTVSASSLSSSGGYKVGFLPRAPEGVLMGKQLSQVPACSSSPDYENSNGYRQFEGKTQQAKTNPAALEPGHPKIPLPIQQDNMLVLSNQEQPPSESGDSEAADEIPYIDDDDDSEETPPLPPPRIIPPPPKRPLLPDNAILETDLDADSPGAATPFHLDASSEDDDSFSLPSLPPPMLPLPRGTNVLASKGFTPTQPSISSSGKPFTEVSSKPASEAGAPIPRVDIQEASGPQTHSGVSDAHPLHLEASSLS